MRATSTTSCANYRILSELNTEGKSKQNPAKGFDFDFYQHIEYQTNTYYFLYDQGYMLLDNGQ
jgi:hypothetical protein